MRSEKTVASFRSVAAVAAPEGYFSEPERPEKALGERISKEKAMQDMIRYMKTPSADMSPGLQGFLINFELSNFPPKSSPFRHLHEVFGR